MARTVLTVAIIESAWFLRPPFRARRDRGHSRPLGGQPSLGLPSPSRRLTAIDNGLTGSNQLDGGAQHPLHGLSAGPACQTVRRSPARQRPADSPDPRGLRSTQRSSGAPATSARSRRACDAGPGWHHGCRCPEASQLDGRGNAGVLPHLDQLDVEILDHGAVDLPHLLAAGSSPPAARAGVRHLCTPITARSTRRKAGATMSSTAAALMGPFEDLAAGRPYASSTTTVS